MITTNVKISASESPEFILYEGEDYQKKKDSKSSKKVKFLKSSQPEKYDLIAIAFLKKLFEKNTNYNAIYFEDAKGNAKRMNIKELREELAKPVKKYMTEEYQIISNEEDESKISSFRKFLDEDAE